MPLLATLLLLFCVVSAPAETQIAAPEAGLEVQETTHEEEAEEHGIIPEGNPAVSTMTLTPITMLPDKKPYEQGLEQMAIARELSKKGKMEAASDVSLQAYDDLMGVYMPRKNSKKRQQLRLERRQAATLYIDTSIAYIQEYVKKRGSTPEAVKEGRARMNDLWDVAKNYPELTKKLNSSLAALQAS